MKYKLLIKILSLLLFVTNTVNGQDSCLYSHSWVTSEIHIEFHDSNNFIYHYSDCTQSKIGYGVFTRSKKRIKLMFKTVEPTKNSYILRIDSFKNNSDSVIITFKVRDEVTQEGIFMSSISVYDSLNKKYFGIRTGENGIGNIKVKADNKLINFNINSLGYKSVIAPIILSDYNYEVTVNMNYWTEVSYGDGDIIEYKIGRVSNDSIQLKVGNSEYIDYKITCR